MDMIYYECVFVDLGIPHAMRIRHIVVCSPPGQCFATLSHKQHDFRTKVICIKWDFLFSLQLLCETFLILRRIKQDNDKDLYWS
jgi:hypothetical protein